ncbi:hypothetical protein OsJ_07253 [Oryza sativa Japonica Group]|uniref:Glycosyltransferase N-terminal domain-containing protein n=1 Tax=Oryza sativa subsp. japonica TaxID=39947 RepID=B9F0Q4_ORYSJ|nr:hypothetical protein OsJ_07253 [Oryza sativa Japonica Group]
MVAADEIKPHAVCLPFPAQGHVTPMMKLAKVLHCRGFHVTFVNTEYNHRRLIRSRGAAAVAGVPGFRFATIPDGLPPSDADATQDPASICYSTMTTCLPHFTKLLVDLDGSRAAGIPPVTCVVADGVMSFAVDAAKELGVPCALFWTASACGYMGYRHHRFFLDEGLSPLKDEEQLTNGFLDTVARPARGMSKHMRYRDYPSFIWTTDRGDILLNFLLHEVERADRADAVILNTFDELEQQALDAMRAILPPVYTIGPLGSLADRVVAPDAPAAAIRPSLWKEDTACLAWLDGREPRSVVFVNYGSITTMSNDELVEFAWGLANCGHGFLWIVRPDLVRGDAAVLPREFLEAVAGEGPPGELVRAGGRAAARGGGRVPDALRLELDDGEPQRRGADAVLALLRRAADQRALLVRRVGRRDGGGRRRAAGGGGGDDQGGHGRGEGEGDEAEGGGVEGARCEGDAAWREVVGQPGQSDQGSLAPK